MYFELSYIFFCFSNIVYVIWSKFVSLCVFSELISQSRAFFKYFMIIQEVVDTIVRIQLVLKKESPWRLCRIFLKLLKKLIVMKKYCGCIFLNHLSSSHTFSQIAQSLKLLQKYTDIKRYF